MLLVRDRSREFRIRIEESAARPREVPIDEGHFAVTVIGERGMPHIHRHVSVSACDRAIAIDAVLALVRGELERRGQ